MAYYVDPDIASTERVFPMQGRAAYRRFDMNENPSGLPEAFVSKVLKEITPEFLATYPEPDRFLNAYAAFLNVPRECVTACNGSDMAIRYVFETFGEHGKDVVTVSPTFEMYWVECRILGLNHVPVPYESDLTISVEKILAAITKDTRIVVLTNPNNPVGNVYEEADVRRIIEKAASVNAVVMIDEAYHYFYERSLIDTALSYDNVLVLRTFSKLFSLAALRLGTVIGDPKLIHFVNNGKLTFDVNSVALLFVERVIEEPGLLKALIESEKEGKRFFVETLRASGYEVTESEANFVFVRTKGDALTVARRLEEEEKILVHPYKNPLLRPFIRVSTGSKADMAAFLDAFFKIDRSEEA